MRPAVQAADAIMEATPEREEKPRAATKSEESIEEKRRKPVRPTMKQPAPRVEKPAEEKPIDEPRAASEVACFRRSYPSESETPRRPFERRAKRRLRARKSVRNAPPSKLPKRRNSLSGVTIVLKRSQPTGAHVQPVPRKIAAEMTVRLARRSVARMRPQATGRIADRINVPVPQREIVRIVGCSSAAVLRHAAATIGIRSRTSAAALLLFFRRRCRPHVLVTAVGIVGATVAVETDHHAGLFQRADDDRRSSSGDRPDRRPPTGRPAFLHEMENAVAAVRQPVGGPAEDALRVLAGTTAEIVQLEAPAATGHRSVDPRGAVALGHEVPQSDRAVVGPRADLGSEPKISPLALGAVVGAPAGHHDFADRRPAIHTRLILAPIHAMPVLKRSASSFSVDVIRHG